MILSKDWKKLSTCISYPITIGEMICENEQDIQEGKFEGQFSEAFYTAVKQELCVDMFCNSQGILLSGKLADSP